MKFSYQISKGSERSPYFTWSSCELYCWSM